ncbi:WAT1-related protein [Capsicum galapagoense]
MTCFHESHVFKNILHGTKHTQYGFWACVINHGFFYLFIIFQASILKIYEVCTGIPGGREKFKCLDTISRQSSHCYSLFVGIIGMALRSCMTTWCLKKADPLFVSMFKPLGIVFAVVIGAFCFRDVFYFGSLVGSAIIVVGFYSVIWGKAKEWKEEEKSLRSNNKNMPLLQDKVDDPEVNL